MIRELLASWRRRPQPEERIDPRLFAMMTNADMLHMVKTGELRINGHVRYVGLCIRQSDLDKLLSELSESPVARDKQ